MQWFMAYAENEKCRNTELLSIEEIKKSGFDIISATVPGSAEQDLMKAGILPDLYYSVNTLDAKKTENLHYWYFTEFETDSADIFLQFEGIDTIADIYINGKKVQETDNMFMSWDVYADYCIGRNEVVVHIKPPCIEAKKYTLPVSSYAAKYNYQSLYVRKAAHMYGWDIMPRIVSAGIWKSVKIMHEKKDCIKEVYFVTNKIDYETKQAKMGFYINADVSGDFITDYSVKVRGNSKNSSFEFERELWHNSDSMQFTIDDAELWWPKNYGEAHLYDTTVELYYKKNLCDTYRLNIGVRTVELKISEMDAKSGEFCFEINGRKIFVLGTNWVPLDAFHSNDAKRLDKALDMLDDIGCNAVRCWGGNVYESDEFFDFCDKKGIIVWQDFAMGCAVYPQENRFAEMLEKEAVYQIKRLRNHASLVLWAGDNECDIAYSWNGFERDPNVNILTRNVLKQAVITHDYSRPYLPSSPYLSELTYKNSLPMPEDHLWGPRDYFKGEFYKNSVCHFASETGYHGFNSPESLKKFLENPEKIFEENGAPTDEYLVHAASMETDENAPYGYRIRLAYTQVETLFGKAEKNFDDFVKQSQISQAEAKKYFIEKFRIGKWYRTGIIWWNLLDGWPQVSDAVVDYYFTKKLAYSYIKRSQQPVCLMFDEPENNMIELVGVNDLQEDKELSYTVTDVTEGKEVMSGKARLCADASTRIDKMLMEKKRFYLIKWEIDGKEYKNHYYSDLIGTDYKKYSSDLQKCGFDEYEGF